MTDGYRATVDGDGVTTIHDVEIFTTCQRDGFVADDAWVRNAVAMAQMKEGEGYLPPLFVRHHESDSDDKDVRPAGHFRITGARPITLEGKRRTGVFADLIITDPSVAAEVLAKQLPYRSVEIFEADTPFIDGLALLDHQAPFLRFPMLHVKNVLGVPGETFAYEWSMDTAPGQGSVVASFRQDRSRAILFRDDHMTTATQTPVADAMNKNPPAVKFADDAEPPKKKEGEGEGEEMEGGGETLDVGSVVKAISKGSISIADMDAILEAIQNQRGTEEPEAVAPAEAPGAESMKNEAETITMAAIQGEVVALRAKDAERDARDIRKDDVAKAMVLLDGRPMGADLESELVAFHQEHGAKAFAAYVTRIDKTFGAVPTNGDRVTMTGTNNIPAVAMRYQGSGPDAVEKAARFADEWSTLRASGSGIRQSQERYIEIQMGTTAPDNA